MLRKTCAHCGNEFDGYDKRRFCSFDCYTAHLRDGHSALIKRVTHTCKECGKEFSKRPSDRKTKFCSNACYRHNTRRIAQQRIELEFDEPIADILRRLYWDEMKTSKQICKAIKIQPRQFIDWCDSFGIKRRDRSTAVAKQWTDRPERRTETADAMRQMHKDGTINNFGDNSPMRTPEMRKHFSDMRKGSGNPMWNKLGPESVHWKGGKITYRGAGWISVRTRIVRRDGYKCRRCGETKMQLQVHHIIPYRETQNNSPDNLITLCVRCHALAERGSIDLFAENVIDSELAKRLFEGRELQLSILFD